MEESLQPITWTIPEYTERRHSNDWYWSIGLATFVAIVLSIFYKNYLLGVLLAIGISSLLYFTARAPRLFTISLNERGMRLNEILFLYSDIQAFWIEEEDQLAPGHPRHLLIMTNRRVMPLIALPIDGMDPEPIKQRLAPFIKEEPLEEPKTHKFLEVLGF
jgi:hypothetical protein